VHLVAGKPKASHNFLTNPVSSAFLALFYQQSHLAAKQEKYGRRKMAAEFCPQSVSFLGYFHMP
jgi:hypothetical protein